MTFKNKASAVAENARHTVQETADKLGHTVSETLHKGKRALDDVVLSATELARSATTMRESRAEKLAEKARAAARGAGEVLEKASDKLKDAGK